MSDTRSVQTVLQLPEKRLQAIERQRVAIQKAQRQIAEESKRLQRETGPANPSRERAEDSGARISEAVNGLVAAGFSVDAARNAASGAMQDLKDLFSSDADRQISDLMDSFDRMAGRFNSDADAANKLEEAIRGIAQALEQAGRSSEIEGLSEALRSQFEAAKKERELQATRKSIEEIVTSIEAENRDFGKTTAQLIEEKLRKLGATQEVIDKTVKEANELQAKKDAAAERANKVETSVRSFGTFSSGSFDPRSVASGTGLWESTRETARNTRRMVSLLERNQLVYGA